MNRKYPKKIGKKRSRAITKIVKNIGLDIWKELSISSKNKAIRRQMAKTKKIAKEGRTAMKALNKELRGKIQKKGKISFLQKTSLSSLFIYNKFKYNIIIKNV